MNPLKHIISVRDVCSNETAESLSGLDLMDAPEISALNLASIANEIYVTGLNLARKKVEQATLLVRNDLMTALAASSVMPDIKAAVHTTGTFKTEVTFPAEAKERGLTIYKNSRIRGGLRKLRIQAVKVYPLSTLSDVALKIYDDYAGGTVTTYRLDLRANEVNSFTIDYELKGTFARVLLDGTGLPVASAYLTCFTGCNGTMPNDCGFTKGWYDDKEISGKEGFGLVLDFACECDYEQLLADLATTYIGEIVWLKARVLLMEEHLRTNRLNNWVIYGRDETKEYLIDVENQYREKWKVLMSAMPGLLKQYKDDCLQCNGIKWVTNL